MAQFNIADLESSVDSLITAHEQLRADYGALRQAHEDEARRNREIRDQLAELIERIRAMEAEAGNV